MDLKVTSWSQENPPTEEAIRELLDEQEIRVHRWSNEPEYSYDGHTHGYHKVVYVVSGSIKFDFPVRRQSLNLTPGDRLDLPAGIRHSAVVGPEGVTCLEAHIY